MSKTAITIEIDEAELARYSDQRLALCWHLAQANPADGFEHSQPGDLAARIGWEIIRRWLGAAPIELYHHQQAHYAQHQLGKFARYTPGGPAWDHEANDWNPAFHDGHYEPRMIPATKQLREALAAKLADLGAWAGTLSREQIAWELTSIVLSGQTATSPTGEDQDPGGQASEPGAQ